ncbi:hypothetical protein [Paenibacillus sp. NPDC058071]|uniref:hypothetical protein n=1 Tax=Paenibacillus sp. NPDC058071 TaxID=3346326 RepID=UPI0036DF8E70
MTMSKKGSRKIRIGQEVYRWGVSPAEKSLILTVHHDQFNGQLIRVSVKSDINNLWVEFPDINSIDTKLVLPSDVVIIINEALNQGWTPKKQGKLLCFTLEGKALIPQ